MPLCLWIVDNFHFIPTGVILQVHPPSSVIQQGPTLYQVPSPSSLLLLPPLVLHLVC